MGEVWKRVFGGASLNWSKGCLYSAFDSLLGCKQLKKKKVEGDSLLLNLKVTWKSFSIDSFLLSLVVNHIPIKHSIVTVPAHLTWNLTRSSINFNQLINFSVQFSVHKSQFIPILSSQSHQNNWRSTGFQCNSKKLINVLVLYVDTRINSFLLYKIPSAHNLSRQID